MVKPAIDHVETAANKMMFLMPPIPGISKSSSLAKSAFNPTASALPQVQSYFDPEQGVEYWFDPQVMGHLKCLEMHLLLDRHCRHHRPVIDWNT